MSATPDPRIAAVTLDVGGVLTLPPVIEVLAAHGIRVTPGELLVAHHRGVAAEDGILASSPGAPDAVGAARRALFDEVAETCGARGVAHTAVVDALAEIAARGAPWSVVVPGALRVVDALREVGVEVAVVSNSDGTVAQQLASLGICQEGEGPAPKVAAIVDSGVVGIRKPDPAIFDHALTALGTERSTTAHVGDTVAFDVLAAERAGLVPVHFDASRTCAGDHAHIASLEELPGLLAR